MEDWLDTILYGFNNRTVDTEDKLNRIFDALELQPGTDALEDVAINRLKRATV